jgi:uncharacterized protein (TIGR02246 family)
MFQQKLERRKEMKATWIIAVSILIFAGTTIVAQTADAGKTEAAIRHAVDEVSAALAANDVNKLRTIFADDYAFINPNGMLLTRSQSLGSIEDGSVKFLAFKLDDVQIRVYGDSAVATAKVTVKMTDRGAEVSGTSRNTMVFTTKAGSWKLVASQATPIKAN